MAAAEYYNPGITISRPGQHPNPAPAPQQLHPPQPHPAGVPSNAPYPLYDGPPPPYQSPVDQQRPQSQPPPNQRYGQQPQPQYPAYPPQQNGDTHQYPPEKLNAPQRPSGLQNMQRPNSYTAPHTPYAQNGYPQQNGGYVGPGLSQVYANQQQQQKPPRQNSTPAKHSTSSPYRRSSRSRSRSRDRRKYHTHQSQRPSSSSSSSHPQQQKRKGSGVNTFLGAGGGAIVGDLIFPGLGTIGGALLGGVGGHKYDKEKARARSSPNYSQRSGSYSGSRREGYYEDDHSRGRKY